MSGASSIQQIEREASDYDDQPAEPWKPSVGDSVAGTIRLIDSRSTEFDPAVPVIELETAAGSRIAVWAFHTVLRSELKRLGAQVGDEIAIRRLEDSGKGYKRYRVFTPKEQAREFSWDTVSVDGGDVAPVDQEGLLRGNSGSDRPISEPDDDLGY